jgi:hypothetical protein
MWVSWRGYASFRGGRCISICGWLTMQIERFLDF